MNVIGGREFRIRLYKDKLTEVMTASDPSVCIF